MIPEVAVPTKIGLLAVRRSIFINSTPERVWQEFTTFERLNRWFGIGHRLIAFEPGVGTDVLLEVDHEGKTKQFGGKLVVFEAGREITFENDWIPNEGWMAPTLITIRLSAALGGTIVEIFHHSIENVGGGAAEQHRGFEAGWGMWHLEALREVVEGS
jgi:uncharacterized protein YndB with AHSA1/START domain